MRVTKKELLHLFLNMEREGKYRIRVLKADASLYQQFFTDELELFKNKGLRFWELAGWKQKGMTLYCVIPKNNQKYWHRDYRWELIQIVNGEFTEAPKYKAYESRNKRVEEKTRGYVRLTELCRRYGIREHFFYVYGDDVDRIKYNSVVYVKEDQFNKMLDRHSAPKGYINLRKKLKELNISVELFDHYFRGQPEKFLGVRYVSPALIEKMDKRWKKQAGGIK